MSAQATIFSISVAGSSGLPSTFTTRPTMRGLVWVGYCEISTTRLSPTRAPRAPSSSAMRP